MRKVYAEGGKGAPSTGKGKSSVGAGKSQNRSVSSKSPNKARKPMNTTQTIRLIQRALIAKKHKLGPYAND